MIIRNDLGGKCQFYLCVSTSNYTIGLGLSFSMGRHSATVKANKKAPSFYCYDLYLPPQAKPSSPPGKNPGEKHPLAAPCPVSRLDSPPHTQGDKRKSPRSQQAHPVLTQSSESTPRSYLLAFALAHCVIMDKVDAIIYFYTSVLGIKVYYFKTGVFIPLSVISVYHELCTVKVFHRRSLHLETVTLFLKRTK